MEDGSTEASTELKLDLSFLPKELVSICSGVIQVHYQRNGYADLTKILADRDIMPFVLIHDDLRALTRSSLAFRKLRLICWTIGLGLSIAAVISVWWVALIIVPVFVVDRYLRSSYRKIQILICAFILALELVAYNVGGLSHQLPKVGWAARRTIDKYLSNSSRKLLDIYLPNLNDLDQSKLEALLRGRDFSVPATI